MKNNGDASAAVGEGRRGRLLEEHRATSRRVEFSVFGTQQHDLTPNQTEQSRRRLKPIFLLFACVGTSQFWSRCDWPWGRVEAEHCFISPLL